MRRSSRNYEPSKARECVQILSAITEPSQDGSRLLTSWYAWVRVVLDTLKDFRRPDPPSRPADLPDENWPLYWALRTWQTRKARVKDSIKTTARIFNAWAYRVEYEEIRAHGNLECLNHALIVIEDIDDPALRTEHERVREFIFAEYQLALERGERDRIAFDKLARKAVRQEHVIPTWLLNMDPPADMLVNVAMNEANERDEEERKPPKRQRRKKGEASDE